MTEDEEIRAQNLRYRRMWYEALPGLVKMVKEEQERRIAESYARDEEQG